MGNMYMNLGKIYNNEFDIGLIRYFYSNNYIDDNLLLNDYDYYLIY